MNSTLERCAAALHGVTRGSFMPWERCSETYQNVVRAETIAVLTALLDISPSMSLTGKLVLKGAANEHERYQAELVWCGILREILK